MNSLQYFSILGIIIINIIIYRAFLKDAIHEFFRLNKLVKNGRVGSGEIIDIVEKSDLDGRTQYAPLIRYFVNNTMYEYQSDDFSFKKPIVGSVIDICYNNSNPIEVIDNYKSVLLFKAFVIIFIVTVLVGLNCGIIYEAFLFKEFVGRCVQKFDELNFSTLNNDTCTVQFQFVG
jgi:hypothetical protein